MQEGAHGDWVAQRLREATIGLVKSLSGSPIRGFRAAKEDPAFARASLDEATAMLMNGKTQEARLMMRDLTHGSGLARKLLRDSCGIMPPRESLCRGAVCSLPSASHWPLALR
jgi:hypothetical protein